MGITLYYNADCSDCGPAGQSNQEARLAQPHRILNPRFPHRPRSPGQIVVADNSTDKVFTGIYATRMICLQVPAFALVGLALHIPPVRKFFGRNKPGCNGDACEI